MIFDCTKDNTEKVLEKAPVYHKKLSDAVDNAAEVCYAHLRSNITVPTIIQEEIYVLIELLESLVYKEQEQWGCVSPGELDILNFETQD